MADGSCGGLKMEEKFEKLIELIKFIVEVDYGITTKYAEMIYKMIDELKEE